MEPKIIHKLDPVISEVKKKTGINIDNFKPTFLERRILFRMRTVGILDYDEYVKLLSTSFDEAKSLYTAFSINVTKFFRDPHVWEKLENDIIPNFLKTTRFSPIRAWSCGSASGEEPHSISILLNDSLKETRIGYQVYATDISADAITHAKKGIYRNENLINVHPERLNTHFEKTSEGHYQVSSVIRNRIEYERLDMLKTTGKLFDIIFCRNVLIYYDKDAHEQIFKKFADVLKKDGILVLGQDESMIGTKGCNYFELPCPKERIYQKKSQ
ncbi:CheR family methyltransferase [Nitrosopumilus ureiphilus]|nr:protein-glutamate O-methyltransferase CheR [Nitrosopumilus ureiphilus]